MLSFSHPGEELLLQYADGELPVKEADKVKNHLASCWQCRSSLEELERVITGCVRHHQTISDHFPSPPAPWCDIRRGFAEVDATLGSRSFSDLVKGWISGLVAKPVRWAPVLGGLVAAAVVVQHLANAPSAKAAELLRQAVAASDTRPLTPRKVEIRARGRNLMRTISAPLPVTNTVDAAAFSEVESMFRAAHYSWDDPLSAKSFSDWRSRLESKSDEVQRDAGSYEIRTSTDQGSLLLATLKLRQTDMAATESMLRFRNEDVVEIREISPEAVVSSAAPAITAGGTRAASAGSPASEATPVAQATAPVSMNDELQVWVALHRAGADLGDPIEVSRLSDRIVVKGMGVPPARQRQIQQELASQRRVEIQFSEPAGAVPAAESRTLTAPTPNPGIQKVQDKIERYVGGRSSYDQFADGVLRESETLLSHAHALRRLAEHFPSEYESQLSADQRHLLQSLCQDHAETLGQKIAVLQLRMKPVLGALGASNNGITAGTAAATEGSASWQQATDELLREARHADSLLAVMLIGATGDAAVDRLPDEVSQSLRALQARIASYRGRRTQ